MGESRYVEAARKAVREVTGTVFCQYGMHMVPIERATWWRGSDGLRKRICLTCKERRK